MGPWWIVMAGLAMAQDGARPAPLSVLSLDEETPCPTVLSGAVPRVIQTSVGLALHRGNGTYAYGCPSRWADDPEAPHASTPTGTEIFGIPNGAPRRTTNGGCSVREAPLPEGLEAVDLLFWRDAFWVLAAADDGSDAGALLRWESGAEVWTPIQQWTVDFRPDNMVAGGTSDLWIVSELPRLRIRRLTFDGGISDSGSLPFGIEGFDGAEVTAQAADEDEAWFVLRRAGRSWTWHAQVVESDNTVVVFTEPGDRYAFVSGPVLFEDYWLASLDGKLAYASQNADEWTVTSFDAPWTCLDRRGTRVFACTVPAMLVVEAVTVDAPPVTSEVFSFYQVVGPDPSCSDDVCDADFEAMKLRLPFDLPEEPGICPDGTTEAELFGDDCGCDTSPGGAAAWSWALLGLFGWRRRQSPAPRQR